MSAAVLANQADRTAFSTFAALQEYLEDPPESELPWLERAIGQCIARLMKCYDPYPPKSEASRQKLKGKEINVDGEKVEVFDTERELALKVSSQMVSIEFVSFK
jgi:hypothetical protein